MADLHDVVVVGAAHVVEHGVELIIPAQPGVVAALCGVRVTIYLLSHIHVYSRPF